MQTIVICQYSFLHGMSKCQQLEQLRNELKKKMNDIIDEAIDKLQDIMGDVSSSDGDNKLYAKNEKRVDTTLNYSQNETSETSDNDSVTLDYTCVDNVLSPDSETASSTQDSIISNSVPLKESNVSSQLSQRESDKKPFVSPILERCARQSMKRTQSDQSVVLGYSV